MGFWRLILFHFKKSEAENFKIQFYLFWELRTLVFLVFFSILIYKLKIINSKIRTKYIQAYAKGMMNKRTERRTDSISSPNDELD